MREMDGREHGTIVYQDSRPPLTWLLYVARLVRLRRPDAVLL